MFESISDLAANPIMLIAVTIGAYFLADTLYRKTRTALVHPLITATLTVVGYLLLCGIEYERYMASIGALNFFLGVSIVGLGYLLHENLGVLAAHPGRVTIAILSGSACGILGVILLGHLFGLDPLVTISLEPKSVTAPIAIVITESTDGIVSLTVLAVVMTGIFGSLVGGPFLRLIGIKDPVAKGLAMGTAAHAVGTAKALEWGHVEGATSGAAIALAGFSATFFVPLAQLLFF